MSALTRIAFIGNSLPRRCGIATFTTDLQQAIAAEAPQIETGIVAMNDFGGSYDYPPSVVVQIGEDSLDDYVRAADFLNAGKYQIVSLQHEFGIFGGEAGSHILTLLSRLTIPVVTTFHTVLAQPSPAQRRVMERIVDASSRVIVMAEKGRELLRSVYRVAADKIDVIAHGIPDFAFVAPDAAKAKLGFAGKPVILTFGLLSPNKGIEVMIDAMPSILRTTPDAVYVVLGATHPNLVRNEGEAYRDSLVARAAALGVSGNMTFLDQFVDQPTLLDFISMCDVYVTPYLNAAQMTSGTLAYSFGLGKAVVSTPYWHAQEMLADGGGILVPFGDADAIGAAIAGLLTDHDRRQEMRVGAYSSSRSMTWARTAGKYLSSFESARQRHRLRMITRPRAQASAAPPDLKTGHLFAMCDDTGLFQHAVQSVPNRAHGYCVDDNARALLLASALATAGEQRLPDILISRFASFVQHAWNPDTRRFRNFMGFDRTWLEDVGSEDSHGRTLWALGNAARHDTSALRRSWAAGLFAEALPSVEGFTSPRSWAFALLGLDDYCAIAENGQAEYLRRVFADRLLGLLEATETSDWVWFEDGLAYDNARLCQALIATGIATNTPAHTAAGLRTMAWLMSVQTAPSGFFRPVGSQSFGDKRKPPLAFDQQPLEATATIAACLAAARVDGNAQWHRWADAAFAWFMGANDLGERLVDVDTGSCRDGLHPDRPNENRGGESVISYLLALVDMRRRARLALNTHKAEPARLLRA